MKRESKQLNQEKSPFSFSDLESSMDLVLNHLHD